jgi:hypothetical protein
MLSADDILLREWPEPEWAVPGILPVGLSVLAGPPKVGKSWLSLQIAFAVASGGIVLGVQVEKGPVLYLALEDPPRRLRDRMNKQGWPIGLKADFITMSDFRTSIGDLSKGGFTKLASLIKIGKYRIVIIDTFSRAFSGDQNDVEKMTSALTPIQEMSNGNNCAISLIDHHNKHSKEYPDPTSDILGSIAKSGVPDTVLGLYQERGKPGARLSVIGRDVEYKSLDLKMDWNIGAWQLDNRKDSPTSEQNKTYNALQKVGQASSQELANQLERNRGSVYRDLVELEKRGLVIKTEDDKWIVMGS